MLRKKRVSGSQEWEWCTPKEAEGERRWEELWIQIFHHSHHSIETEQLALEMQSVNDGGLFLLHSQALIPLQQCEKRAGVVRTLIDLINKIKCSVSEKLLNG